MEEFQMNEKHQKSESERRQLIDISTIGVLFCLILALYFFAERGVVYPEKVEETAPPDTGKMVVIVIKPEMPEPIESPRSVQKELGKIVQNDQHLKPLLRTIEIDPIVVAALDLLDGDHTLDIRHSRLFYDEMCHRIRNRIEHDVS